ncbi:MAG TPA: homocysteine S-methyltransferase family protein [Patescibacteria group bacterium]|nr:homocysteine S-methyltransferase family protein [Patescibacteria group bacterium]
MDFQTLIERNPLIVTEGSVIERIKRETRYHLDGDIANAGMIYDAEGSALLSSIYREYIDAAKRHGLPILILTPTWRASRDRLERAGLAGTGVNRDCSAFLSRIRDDYGEYGEKILIGGLMGGRGDAYDPEGAPDAESARAYHSFQVEELAGAGVDLLVASTLPSIREAAGMAAAMVGGGLPYILSFIIRANGNLMDGTPLREAIATIDAAARPAPSCYMLNCVHPDNVRDALAAGSHTAAPLGGRLIGLQGNASRRSPEELDGRAGLDADPPERWARAMLRLHTDFGMSILGGCCGTDTRHIERLAGMYAELRDGGPGDEAAEPVELPIDGTLDLHTFRANEVKDLVPEYLTACRERGILDVRIIHGKGTGALRETVHAILRRLPYVERFRLAGEDGGGWGATIVTLNPE